MVLRVSHDQTRFLLLNYTVKYSQVLNSVCLTPLHIRVYYGHAIGNALLLCDINPDIDRIPAVRGRVPQKSAWVCPVAAGAPPDQA